MSINKRPGGPYVTPLLTDDGSEAAKAGARGQFTLTANKVYACPLGGVGSPTQSVQLQGDSAVVITSAVIEETNCDDAEVTNISTAAGDWVKDNGTAGQTSAIGTNWTATARTIAATGTNQGAGMWQLPDRGARRTRLLITVGATGGVVRVAAHGKE